MCNLCFGLASCAKPGRDHDGRLPGHQLLLGTIRPAETADAEAAVEAAREAARAWRGLPFEERGGVPASRGAVVRAGAGASGRRHDAGPGTEA
ncbi:aldehyde dehydrogenase family protein [Saccharopolyspora pogona]|uniref:aldehyde dehydrogenase family protein n=1 Tax=Saccharopolyspora pogona TaxID=333966 RepID=UPI00295B3546|nr:aldehyde dehydrogenase family protein [Saccharopolyspora pogona]